MHMFHFMFSLSNKLKQLFSLAIWLIKFAKSGLNLLYAHVILLSALKRSFQILEMVETKEFVTMVVRRITRIII